MFAKYPILTRLVEFVVLTDVVVLVDIDISTKAPAAITIITAIAIMIRYEFFKKCQKGSFFSLILCFRLSAYIFDFLPIFFEDPVQFTSILRMS